MAKKNAPTEPEDQRFSERIREHAGRLGVFTARELADALEVKTRDEKRAVSAYIRNFILRNEMERAGKAPNKSQRYRLAPRTPKVSRRQRLWNIVRRMPSPEFTLADLRQLTGDVSAGQVKRFGQWMVEAGWARRTAPGRFRKTRPTQMPVDAPPDQRSTARCRKTRDRKRREALNAMDRAFTAIAEARMAISEMEDGHE